MKILALVAVVVPGVEQVMCRWTVSQAEVHQEVEGKVAGKLHRQESPGKVYLVSLTSHLEAMTSPHVLAKGYRMEKTGVQWAHDKSADKDGKPVREIVGPVSLH